MSDSPEQSSEVLSVSKDEYGDQYRGHLLEQYKMYAQSAIQVTAWRSSANNFFLAVNTALISLYGFSIAFQEAALWQRFICGGGIVLAIVWWGTVESYRKLNSAKFQVIHELEKHLPAAVFAREWEILKAGRKVLTLTRIERLVPCGFFLIFLGLFVMGFFYNAETQPFKIELDGTFMSPLEIKTK